MKELVITSKARLDLPLPPRTIITEPNITSVLAYGPDGFGDISSGFRSKLWGCYVDEQRRAFTAIRNDDGTWGEWTERFALVDPVADVSLAFDFQGRPMIAYVRENRTFGVWYIPPGQSIPTLIEVGTLPDQTLNYLAFDLNVNDPEFADIGETVLSIVVGNQLYNYFASEAFGTVHTITLSENYDRPWLAFAGWMINKRHCVVVRG